MEIFLAWLLGCLCFWYLFRRLTGLRGGLAVGVTILAGSVPVWILLFSLTGPFMNGNVGLFGGVLLLVLIGSCLLGLGLAVILLGALWAAVKRKKRNGNDAPHCPE